MVLSASLAATMFAAEESKVAQELCEPTRRMSCGQGTIAPESASVITACIRELSELIRTQDPAMSHRLALVECELEAAVSQPARLTYSQLVVMLLGEWKNLVKVRPLALQG